MSEKVIVNGVQWVVLGDGLNRYSPRNLVRMTDGEIVFRSEIRDSAVCIMYLSPAGTQTLGRLFTCGKLYWEGQVHNVRCDRIANHNGKCKGDPGDE